VTSPLAIFLTVASALSIALLVDRLVGDPREGSVAERWYPPVLVGRAASWVERRISRRNPRRERVLGGLGWLVLVGTPVLLAWGLLDVVRVAVPGLGSVSAGSGLAVLGVLALGVSVVWLKSTMALRTLEEFCLRPLDRPLKEMRGSVAQVVNRPTADLPEELLYSALIESAVENATDSMVAPLAAYALLGLPGAVGYRAVNTLDALWGHTDPRWRDIGLVAATVDRAVNYLPDLLTGRLLRLASRRKLMSPRIERPDPEFRIPSTIRSVAGLLRVRLERRGSYVVGAGWPPPTANDVRRAVRWVRGAVGLAAIFCVAVIALLACAGWTYFLA
jgi:adenosylcobinamide-phosphate synthase